MTRKIFGTDGVRGTANSFPMTAEMALRLGMAAGQHFRKDGKNGHRVVIGKDTRLSGYMIENALTAGLTSMGMNAFLLGPVPTPAVGFLTRAMRADLGIMISASHNPHQDNGIKFFGPDGFKLSDIDEFELERLIGGELNAIPPDEIGRARRIDDAGGRYVEYAKTTLPKGTRLDGLRVVLDCANGAAYKVAPETLWELGAEVVTIGASPNGTNINLACGSTNPEACAAQVLSTKADLGITLDGDADRLILIDERGQIADGDQIMALFASRWAKTGKLKGGALVASVMSNLGLERFLQGESLRLERAPVGDRYVVERMREGGFNLGGEQSGHIVMTDYATTGDGLIAALQFMAAVVDGGQKASELTRVFEPVPQVLRNFRYRLGVDVLSHEQVQGAIRDADERLFGRGRLLVRKSGTEPLVRVMAECDDEVLMGEVIDSILERLTQAAA